MSQDKTSQEQKTIQNPESRLYGLIVNLIIYDFIDQAGFDLVNA